MRTLVRLLEWRSRSGIGRTVAAVAVIVVIALAVGVAVSLGTKGTSSTTASSSLVTTSSSSSTTTSTTTSTTSTPTACVFGAPPPVIAANTTVPPIFTGCLTPGSTGMYLIGVADPNGLVAQGVVRTTLPGNITMLGYQVGNFTAAGKGGLAGQTINGTVLPMPDLQLFAKTGYAIVVVNSSNENSTVTINLTLTDAMIYAAAG